MKIFDKLLLLVYTRPNMRDSALEYERYMSIDVIKSMFDDMQKRPDIEHLYLSFPEQWLNIIEQRALFQRIEFYLPNIKSIEIKTHSVYIIQCVPKECCRIVDLAIEETSDQTAKLYSENVLNIFDIANLNAMTPNKVTKI